MTARPLEPQLTNQAHRAACHDTDPDVFYDDTRRPEARGICRGCPMALDCLEVALAAEGGATAKTRYGVFAGTTPAQRRRMYENRARALRRDAA